MFVVLYIVLLIGLTNFFISIFYYNNLLLCIYEDMIFLNLSEGWNIYPYFLRCIKWGVKTLVWPDTKARGPCIQGTGVIHLVFWRDQEILRGVSWSTSTETRVSWRWTFKLRSEERLKHWLKFYCSSSSL